MANNNKIITVVLDFIGAKFELLSPSNTQIVEYKTLYVYFFFYCQINTQSIISIAWLFLTTRN